jgi:hypothetical protein
LFLWATGFQQEVMLRTDKDSRNLVESMPITFTIQGSVFFDTVRAIAKPPLPRYWALEEMCPPEKAEAALSTHRLVQPKRPLSRQKGAVVRIEGVLLDQHLGGIRRRGW